MPPEQVVPPEQPGRAESSAQGLLTAVLPLAVASEVFEDDNGSSLVSEGDSETQSLSSFGSGPTSPCEVPAPCPPAARPGSLELPSPGSLAEFGAVFPALGPRSECSGASSPECEAERGRQGWAGQGCPGGGFPAAEGSRGTSSAALASVPAPSALTCWWSFLGGQLLGGLCPTDGICHGLVLARGWEGCPALAVQGLGMLTASGGV